MIGTEKKKLLQLKEELCEIKQFLLKTAEEMIVEKKNIGLYPLDLLELAKERSKYDESELFENITELYEAKWIVPGENITRNLVLDELDHQRVYAFIIKHPGCDTLDVMKELNISFRYALKNLETLFKFSFIRARKYSQFFLYFPSYISEEEDMIYCLSRNTITRRIIKYLFERKTAATAHEIAKAIRIGEINVLRKLTRLSQARIVSISAEGLITKYKFNKDQKNGFANILTTYKKS